MLSNKKKSNKKSKGYRLEPATHKLISEMCRILKADQNEVLTLACRNYYSIIKEKSSGNYKTALAN